MKPREAFDQGKTVWNQWRKENPDTSPWPWIQLEGWLNYDITKEKVPDHQGSNFSEVHFRFVDISGPD